jgi:hypothetical protein
MHAWLTVDWLIMVYRICAAQYYAERRYWQVKLTCWPVSRQVILVGLPVGVYQGGPHERGAH